MLFSTKEVKSIRINKKVKRGYLWGKTLQGEGEGMESREMLLLNLVELFDSLKDVHVKFINF